MLLIATSVKLRGTKVENAFPSGPPAAVIGWTILNAIVVLLVPFSQLLIK